MRANCLCGSVAGVANLSDRLATLKDDFPDSRYVPCVTVKCPSLKRPAKSKAPTTCHEYLLRTSGAKPEEN